MTDREWLPALLSVIAGMVDVIGFLSFGLFTAHVTGNLVVIAALLVRGGVPNQAQILAVPVFIFSVAAVWSIAEAGGWRGPALKRPLLALQSLLLCCVLFVSLELRPAVNQHGLTAAIPAMLAVSAMASQFALLRLAMPDAPSTAVMTGNLTNATLSLLDTLVHGRALTTDAGARLRRAAVAIAGFFAGCVAGAVAVSALGHWSWLLPAGFAALAAAKCDRPLHSSSADRTRAVAHDAPSI